MANYYELLQLQSTASSQEIEAAIDQLYNDTRHKVTSHDPQIAAQANQAMQLLEAMRNTLLSPEKRAIYDTAAGIIALPGGLTDPEAIFRSPVPSPMAMPSVPMQFGQSVPAPQPAPSNRTDAWVCPKCQHPNQVGTQYCAKDGIRIGNKCPKCGHMTELLNDFCPSCGVNKKQFFIDSIDDLIAQLTHQKQKIGEEITKINRVISGTRYDVLTPEERGIFDELSTGSSFGCSTIIIGGMIFFGVLVTGSILLPEDFAAFLIVIALIGSFFAAIGIHNSRVSNYRTENASKKIKQLETAMKSVHDQIIATSNRIYPE